jgi:hypothetical protein
MLSVLNLFTLYILVVVAGALETQDVEEQRNTTARFGSRTAPSVQLYNNTKEHLSFIFYRPTWLPPLPSAAPTPAPAIDNDQRKNNTWTFKVESGKKGVQVGSWSTDVVYNGFLKALRERCEQTKKGCGAGKCSGGDWGFYAEHTDKLGYWLEERNAAIIKITSDYIPEEYAKPLQDAFVEQIADVFLLAVIKEDKNCYMFDPKAAICTFCQDKFCFARTGPFKNRCVTPKQRLLRWCNIPDFVRVAIVDEAQKEKAHMRVDLRFECPHSLGTYPCRVDLGKFDCVALVTTVEQESHKNETRQRILKTAAKADNFSIATECSSKEVTGSCPNAECMYHFGTCF